MAGELSLAWTAVPPSFNRVGTRGSAMQWQRAKKDWQGIFEGLLMQAGAARQAFQRCEATAELRFPTRRRRDVVNYRTILEKALGDALVNGRWLPDDTPEHFALTRLTFDPELGSEHTLVRLLFT